MNRLSRLMAASFLGYLLLTGCATTQPTTFSGQCPATTADHAGNAGLAAAGGMIAGDPVIAVASFLAFELMDHETCP